MAILLRGPWRRDLTEKGMTLEILRKASVPETEGVHRGAVGDKVGGTLGEIVHFIAGEADLEPEVA